MILSLTPKSSGTVLTGRVQCAVESVVNIGAIMLDMKALEGSLDCVKPTERSSTVYYLFSHCIIIVINIVICILINHHS